MSSDSEKEDEEYVVEAIREWRYHEKNERREFLIKWQGWPDEDNTWEPEEYLNCDEIMKKFVKSLDKEQKKYFMSEDPKRLSGFQRNAKFISCVGADGPHESDEEDSPKAEKQPFYILVTFEDTDLAEEMTLKELYQNRPDEALKFFESRVLISQPNGSRQ